MARLIAFVAAALVLATPYRRFRLRIALHDPDRRRRRLVLDRRTPAASAKRSTTRRRGDVVHVATGTYVVDHDLELRSGATMQGDPGRSRAAAGRRRGPRRRDPQERRHGPASRLPQPGPGTDGGQADRRPRRGPRGGRRPERLQARRQRRRRHAPARQRRAVGLGLRRPHDRRRDRRVDRRAARPRPRRRRPAQRHRALLRRRRDPLRPRPRPRHAGQRHRPRAEGRQRATAAPAAAPPTRTCAPARANVALGAGIQAGEPLFIPGGVRPLAASPTVDAGTADDLTSAADPDGRERAVPDIGAYECCAAGDPRPGPSPRTRPPRPRRPLPRRVLDPGAGRRHREARLRRGRRPRHRPRPRRGSRAAASGSSTARSSSRSAPWSTPPPGASRSSPPSIAPAAPRQGRFWGGRFQIRQGARSRGMTTLKLRGGDFALLQAQAAARSRAPPRKTQARRVALAVGARQGRPLPHPRPQQRRHRARHLVADPRHLRRDAHARASRTRSSVRDRRARRTVLVRAGQQVPRAMRRARAALRMLLTAGLLAAAVAGAATWSGRARSRRGHRARRDVPAARRAAAAATSRSWPSTTSPSRTSSASGRSRAR